MEPITMFSTLLGLVSSHGNIVMILCFVILYLKIRTLEGIVTNGLSSKVSETHDTVTELKAKMATVQYFIGRRRDDA